MDSKDYDHTKNMTLMFFLDRLMDKGQPRTLHDLSCQFGTKGFTKEMRQIAGGSQSGLRKFLQQYPFLFTIDGDQVSVTSFEGDSSGTSPQRDYVQEAIDYFRAKLEQYGNAEVPIKSLLGHRSQATPEIRHVSGQHGREFRDFLAKHSDVFVVKEEHVVLRSVLQNAAQGDAVIKVAEEAPLDSGLRDQLTCIFEAFLRSRGGSASLDALYGHLTSRFSRDTYSRMMQSPQDLSAFLRMNTHRFQIQASVVTLLERTEPVAATSSSSSRGSIQQRLKSHILKAVADNSAMDHKIASVNSAREQDQTLGDMLRGVRVITKVKECEALVSRLSSQHQLVAVDAEGVNLGPQGPLTLVQLATPVGEVFLFDVQSTPQLFAEGHLRDILEAEHITKIVFITCEEKKSRKIFHAIVSCLALIRSTGPRCAMGGLLGMNESFSVADGSASLPDEVMHDCRNDSAALFFQFGIKLQNVFDTQAAHAALQQQDVGKPVHKVKNVSLGTLCALYSGPANPRRDQVKSLYRRDQKFWSRRPLSEDMVFHAAFDVFCLLPGVYGALRGALRPESEPLLWALCEEQALAHISPDEVKQRKKQRKLDHEVDDLRRRLDAARHTQRQVVLSNREIRLLRYVNLTEEECARIDGNPKVARKLDRLRNRGVGAAGSGATDGLPGAGDEDDEEDDDATESESESTDSDLPRSGDWSCDSLGAAVSPSHSLDGPKAPTPVTANGHASENSCCCCGECRTPREGVDAACQTLSTGDIVITKVFFEEQEHGGKTIIQ
ncbi:egalitarian protein homolog isoform X1 [Dermacentor albipictus]|uniref:egalitarian protein homolog isoform X1 n=1 Tax=Dermacentor albipictus TaxID=60249 RepID=UPI0038FC6696